MAMSPIALDFHTIGTGFLIFLIVLLFVGAIVGLFGFMLNWSGFPQQRKRVTRRWLLTFGLCCITIASWGELLNGSASLSTIFVDLGVTLSYVSALRYRRKPSAWEPSPPTGVFPSLWEHASPRYRVGATAIILLGLSAGLGMLAHTLL